MKYFPLCLIMLVHAALDAAEWLYEENVQFESHHDGARIDLIGENVLLLNDVAYYGSVPGPQSLKFSDVATWEVSKPLKIVYSVETGAALLDPTTGKHTEIISGMEKHPLDRIFGERIGRGSTAEIVVACSELSELWQMETRRIFKRQKARFPEEAAIFEQAEKAWQVFCEAQRKVMRVTYDKQGTLYHQLHATESMYLVRDFALNLAKWGRL